MAPRSKGARLKLDEPLASDFLDFRAANYWAPEIEVIRVALRQHIDARLGNEPELKRLFAERGERRHRIESPAG